MKFVVLIKEVPDTWGDRTLDLQTGRIDRHSGDQVVDEIGERALEVALSYRDSHKDAQVVVISMGPASITGTLRRCLALGADSAIHVVDDELAGADLLTTARFLAAAIRAEGFDVVITGNESTDGRGGVLPAMIAELLGVAQLTFSTSVQIDEATIRTDRATDAGTLSLSASLPVVMSITERLPDARFPGLKGLMGAKKKPIATVRSVDLDLAPAEHGSSVVIATTQRPARSAGRRIVDDGTAATQLADFLQSERLI